MRSRLRVRGFTLLEVMVALALLAIGLSALADLTGSALHNFIYAKELSNATLLARGKLAELEEHYDDLGFKDSDETDEGTFEKQGYPDVKWKLEVVKPTAELEGGQLMAVLAGAGDDLGASSKMLEKLMGSGASGANGASAGSATGGTTSGGVASAAAGIAGAGLQTLLAQFGETLKSSLRELRLTVGWPEGKAFHQFTVTTHLVVFCPKAPNDARGEGPDICPTPATR